MGIDSDMVRAMVKEVSKPAPGKLVSVNGRNMHVFSEGQGDETFIFMSGCGTTCPTLDFKPVWSLLSCKHRIAVIDKAGYGWSDAANTPRDLDTLISENRDALKLAGIEGPYILVPHSLSGLEALYWAQKYPCEVKAIIGLDPRTPAYEKLPPKLIVKLLKLAGMFTPDMVNEIKHAKENAEIIKGLPLPSATPVYFFISGKNRDKNWKVSLINYLSGFDYSKYLVLDCNHFVYRYEYKKIVDEINTFVESIGRDPA